MSDADGFLARWSKRKSEVRSGRSDVDTTADRSAPPGAFPTPIPEPSSPARAALSPGPDREKADSANATPAAARPEAEPLPTMEDVALLTRDSDYSRFARPGVEPGVRNAAMKRLFSDPHFNVMDGLDTYIDDYGKPDPIPLSMLRRMNQSRLLGLFADEPAQGEDPPPVLANPDGMTLTPVAQSSADEAVEPPAAASEAQPDDDADLRLQQDDATGRPGPATGSRP